MLEGFGVWGLRVSVAALVPGNRVRLRVRMSASRVKSRASWFGFGGNPRLCGV